MTATLLSTYPDKAAERDRWVLARRPQRNALDPSKPYAFLAENECSSSGEIVTVNTIFLTNRECPWRCLMCDLWKNTLRDALPPGAIPTQIDYALGQLPPATQLKLYNSGSFFDTQAIPLEDYEDIARLSATYERVIVESHPTLVADNCLRLQELLSGQLEVAMGLETAHPEILERLNKKMTLASFSKAAEKLLGHDIDLRVFILVKPPFMEEQSALEWASKSLDFAFDCGATVASLIPTRAGNGALDELAVSGDFAPPLLTTLERAMEYGLSLHRGRVFADLWDVMKSVGCPACLERRVDRLGAMNLGQVLLPQISCELCR